MMPAEPLVCDFCRQPPALFYPCETFALSALQYVSRGNWAACLVCADLIDRQAWPELEARAVEYSLPDDLPPARLDRYRVVVEAWMHSLHEGFRAHRLAGPPSPISAAEKFYAKTSA